ncbi:MAG: FtsX-like permease family protein [Chloroflexota bacterium]
MKHLNFYIQHALRDMTRNGRRTAFALFCVAAGVAAIVALRSLSLTIGDSLAGNIASINHGDLKVSLRGAFDNSIGLTAVNDGRQEFSPELLKEIQSWAEANNVKTTAVISDANIQVTPLDNKQNAGRPQFISSYIIDPAVYPFYGPVTAIDPPGVPLSKLFTGGNDVVISKNLADANKIKVGDLVRVGRTTEQFTVRGIVPTDIEGNVRNMLASFFGFAYFSNAQSAVLNVDNLPSEVYMLGPAGSDVAALSASLGAQVPGLNITTTNDVRAQNQTVADVIDRLIVVMGLAALLIGGTGIIHTMLVVVSRRTVEIAVLKTLGVKGSQITTMFLVESIIMGVVGSLLGILLGIVFSLGIYVFAQNVWPQALGFRLYPQAMFTGFLLGVLITAVFGFLPTLTAAAVRPATVLRPNEASLPTAGCLPTGLGILLVVIAVGLIAGQLIGNLLVGVIGIAIASVMMTVIVGLLYVLIAIVGKLPAFGSVDLRLALRGMGTHRARTASTLLALIVGIFSLSVITLMAESVPRLLNVQFTQVLGGNVMIFGLVPALQRPFILAQLKDKPGVIHYNQVGQYSAKLVAVNGDTNFASRIKEEDNPIPSFGRKGGNAVSYRDIVINSLGSVGTADVAAPAYLPQVVASGRPLDAQDAGKPNMLMQSSPFSDALGLKVGDTVTMSFGGKEATFTIVGVRSPQNKRDLNASSLSNFGTFTAPIDAIPAGVNPTFEFTLAQVDDAHLNEVLVNLSSIPGVFPFDVGFFETLIRRLLEQFTAIPSIVAVLSLFAGAVIIANTVSLATLERRRQVGVMKAIGLSGRRVLGQMVLENGLIGLIGGLIGVGIGVLATLLLSINSQIPITQTISWGIVGILLALSLLISLVATLLSAWTAASEKPINVLRYE